MRRTAWSSLRVSGDGVTVGVEDNRWRRKSKFPARIHATNSAVILRCSPFFRASLEGWPRLPALGLAATARQLSDRGPVAADQRLFFGSAPALDLTLGGNAVGDPVKVFGPHQHDRTAMKRVAGKSSGIMLVDPRLEVIAGRAADIVGIVGAAKHVNVDRHSFFLRSFPLPAPPSTLHPEVLAAKRRASKDGNRRACGHPSRRRAHARRPQDDGSICGAIS